VTDAPTPGSPETPPSGGRQRFRTWRHGVGSSPRVRSWRRFRRSKRGRWIIPTVAVFLAFSFPYWGQDGPLKGLFVDNLGITSDTLFVMAVYVMLALGLNIVVGYAGLLDLGYVAFFALGAYTLGWFGSGLFDNPAGLNANIHFLDTSVAEVPGIHLSFWVVMVLAGLVCAIAGIIIGWPTLRLRGDYLAIVTLGFGEIIPDVFRNGDAFPVPQGVQSTPPFLDFQAENLTNGVRGITQLDRPGFGHQLNDATNGVLPDRYTSLPSELKPWFWTILIMTLFTIFVNLRLRDSKMGRAWIAIREDEIAASAMGVPLMRTKLWAYAIGAIFGGFAGALYGSFINGIFPTSFSFQISVIVLVMVIVGGMGNIWGVMLGACLISWLNQIGLTKIGDWINTGISWTGSDYEVNVPPYKFGILGALLVVMMLFRPEGLIPSGRRKAEFEEGEGTASLYDASA
jgi:branched-chain amino acid transport system permease protein